MNFNGLAFMFTMVACSIAFNFAQDDTEHENATSTNDVDLTSNEMSTTSTTSTTHWDDDLESRLERYVHFCLYMKPNDSPSYLLN